MLAGLKIIKRVIKKLVCVAHGVGFSGKDAYISPRAWIINPERMRLGEGSVVESRARLCANGEKAAIIIGDGTTVYPYALLKTNGGVIEIGKFSSINDYCVLNGYAGIHIGNHVHIAASVMIIASEHDYHELGNLSFSSELSGKGIVIKDNVWIGAGAGILDGVTIGEYAVIGMGAVVTKDIPPYSVAVGVPAKVIKKWK